MWEILLKAQKLVLAEGHFDTRAERFCQMFLSSNSGRPRFVFGINQYTDSIMRQVPLDGVIDDFTDRQEYCGVPVVPIDLVPENALVVVVVVGKPLVAEKRVAQYQFEYLDYFSFYKYARMPLLNVQFQNGMPEDIENNYFQYQGVFELLADLESRNQFYNIINFRRTYDLRYMRGFSAIEHRQYFEDFLELNESGEVFVDIGGYDGFTTSEFIRRSPCYKAVHLFEPEAKNLQIAQDRLAGFKNISFYEMGLSDYRGEIRFNASGSCSKICEDGEQIIAVGRLDDLIDNPVTFIKMDIEGAESRAIAGASETIRKYQPRLAIAAYHKKDDLWRIPEQILAIRDDYQVYLRHYTEGIAETVLFFIPHH